VEKSAMIALEKKITDALADEAVTSANLAALISELEAGIAEANENAEHERAKALDPAASPDPKAAHEALLAAEFACERLRMLVPRLVAHLRAVTAREELARWRSRHNEVKQRRDAAVAKLQALYEPFVEQIVPLLLEIEQIDYDIRQVNATAPPDGTTGMYLQPVEIVARAPSGPSILKDLKLPHWAPHAGQAWPPHRLIDFVQLQMSTLPGGDRRLYSSRWWEVQEEKLRASRGGK
jgi:hypothetical protein